MNFRIFAITLLFNLYLLTPVLYAQDKSAQIQGYFDAIYAQKNFNGCVLVVEEGKPIFSKAYGYADEQQKRMLDTASAFELASVSKMFTAMAIMQLQEKGKLKYEDTVKKFFPELDYPGVTIRNLLTHTSGIPEFLGSELAVNKLNFNADIIKYLVSSKVKTAFKPGTACSYSNTNYLLLATIVEKISGQSFAAYMKKHVFLPAGMLHTEVYSRLSTPKKILNYASDEVWDTGVNGYVKTDDLKGDMTNYLDGVNGPYGVSSTINDLFKWDQALYTEKLVRKETFKAAITPFKLVGSDKFAEMMSGCPFGFGWMLSPSEVIGEEMFHTGGFGGYMNLVLRNTKLKRNVTILSNYNRKAGVFQLMAGVVQLLNGEQPELPEKAVMKKSIPITAGKLKPLVGEYLVNNAPALKMRIRAEGNQLYARYVDQAEFMIYPEADDSFFYSIVPAVIKFSLDKDGKTKKLTYFQNGREIAMTQKL